MKKLNNKGMTTIEILVTFVIVVIIVVSMYASVTSLKDKETIESYKESLITYKNLLTKEIQDDLIIKGLSSATITSNTSPYKMEMRFKDGSIKELEVVKEDGCEAVTADEIDTLCQGMDPDQGAKYSISYGGETFPLPILGVEEIDNFNSEGTHKIYALKIDEVTLDAGNDDGIMSIKIALYHPDFGTRYSINLVAPINYE